MDRYKIRPEWIPSGYKEIAKTEQVDNANRDKKRFKLNTCKDIHFGVAIGDALGVPVEFQSREEISRQPVTEMIGYGTHNKPAGTFYRVKQMSKCSVFKSRCLII